MSTVTVTSQAELDAALAAHAQDPAWTIIIDSPEGVWLTLDLLDGNLAAISPRGHSCLSGVGGSATVSGVRGSATVRGVGGSATVRGVWGSATVSNVWDSATVSDVRGSATVRDVGDSATVSDVGGSATVRDVGGSATVRDVGGSATVSGVRSSATVRNVGGSATVRDVRGSATVSDVWGSATVRDVGGSATVRGVGGSATVRGVRGSATVRGVRGSATVSDVWGTVVLDLDEQSSATGVGPYVTVLVRTQAVTVDGGHVVDLSSINLDDPITWCALVGVTVRDGVATLYKAVDQDLVAGHGYVLTSYPIGGTVTAPDWRDDHKCGGGLHVAPTPRMAASWSQVDATDTRILAVAVPVEGLRPIGEEKAKTPTLTVLYEVTIDGERVAS